MATTRANQARRRLGPDESVPDDEVETIAIDLQAAGPRFHELVERAHRHGLRIVLTRDGQEIAAILPVEHLHWVEDFENRRDLELAERARDEMRREGTIPWDQLKAELDAGAGE